MNVIKIAKITENAAEHLYMCNSCVIWQYHPCDIYTHLQTIGLIGVTELGTATFHFAPNQRRFLWLIYRWILLRRKIFFRKSLMPNVHLFAPSFSFFNI